MNAFLNAIRSIGDRLWPVVVRRGKYEATLAIRRSGSLVGDHWVALVSVVLVDVLAYALTYIVSVPYILPLSTWWGWRWEMGVYVLIYISWTLMIVGWTLDDARRYEFNVSDGGSDVTDQYTVQGNRGLLSVCLLLAGSLIAYALGIPNALIIIATAIGVIAHVPRGLTEFGKGVVAHMAIMALLVLALWIFAVG